MLIRGDGSLEARFQRGAPNGTVVKERETVAFWALLGGELVGYILDDRGRLRRADALPGFVGYREGDGSPVMSVVPAQPGWWVVYRDEEEPARGHWQPVIAWRVGHDGYAVLPVLPPDEQGVSFPVELRRGECALVWDPRRGEAGRGPWPGG